MAAAEQVEQVLLMVDLVDLAAVSLAATHQQVPEQLVKVMPVAQTLTLVQHGAVVAVVVPVKSVNKAALHSVELVVLAYLLLLLDLLLLELAVVGERLTADIPPEQAETVVAAEVDRLVAVMALAFLEQQTLAVVAVVVTTHHLLCNLQELAALVS